MTLTSLFNFGTGHGTFRQDGTSTGGLWDKFPAAGDPVLPGLKPVNDMQTGQ